MKTDACACACECVAGTYNICTRKMSRSLPFLILPFAPHTHLGACTCELGPVEDAPEEFNANKAGSISSQFPGGWDEGECRRVRLDSSALDAGFQESQSDENSPSRRKGAMPGDLVEGESSPWNDGIDMTALVDAGFRELPIAKKAPALFRKGALSVGRANRTANAFQV